MVSKIKSDEIEASTSGASVDFNSSLRPMSKTTTEMNALSGMGAGDMIYNETEGTLYVYNGTSWNAMSGNTFSFTLQYLLIAGGGAGGHQHGGGGGAGGYRNSYASENTGGGASTESTLTVSWATNYTVTIGDGCAGTNYKGKG